MKTVTFVNAENKIHYYDFDVGDDNYQLAIHFFKKTQALDKSK